MRDESDIETLPCMSRIKELLTMQLDSAIATIGAESGTSKVLHLTNRASDVSSKGFHYKSSDTSTEISVSFTPRSSAK
jgi:hypothetical protein